jgi:hypothetical protein
MWKIVEKTLFINYLNDLTQTVHGPALKWYFYPIPFLFYMYIYIYIYTSEN